jgi:alpha-ketoglutarate-dependent taurine dioxygenase
LDEVVAFSLLSECVVEPGGPAVLGKDWGTLDETCEWLRSQRDQLRGVLDVHGALVLAGLPVWSPGHFARVRDCLITERAAYREKATPRSSFGDDVYSSTDFPAAQSIRPHNENSYTLAFPALLAFCCLISPDEGGATPVTDVRQVLRDIPQVLLDEFRSRGWALMRNYSDDFGLPWTTAFGTSDKAKVDEYCAGNLIANEWRNDGALRTTQRRSALITHPRTGDEVWFNHLVFWSEWSLLPMMRDVMIAEFGSDGLPFSTMYGDGEPVAEQDIKLIDDAYHAATVRRSWAPGDVMIVDNLLAAHGREPFTGDRRVLVAMGDPIDLADCGPTVPPLAGFTR